MELEEINLCGPLVSKLIDLDTSNEALQPWITLTSLTELEINPVSDLGVFNFRVQIHDETDLVNPLLTSDIQITLLYPCASTSFYQHEGISPLNTKLADLQL